MKKLAFLFLSVFLFGLEVKNCDTGDVQLKLEANGDFNVTEGNFTVNKGIIHSEKGGGYFAVANDDVNTSYALQVGGDIYIAGNIIYGGDLVANKPHIDIESSKTIDETDDDQTLTVKVTLSEALDENVTFHLKTNEGSGDDGALEDEDYDGIDDDFTIKAGDTSTEINITIKGDDTYEYDDKFTAVISDNSDNVVIGNDTCDITINNDDDKPTIKVKDDVSAKESDDANFEIDLSAAAGVPVTFHITITNGDNDDNTADTDDDDWTDSAPLDADFTIDKGDTSKTVTANVNDDDDDEDDEHYTFKLTNADNAVIDTDNDTKDGTIENDDSSGWFSDIRLKKDIHPLNNVLPKIDEVRPVTFHWKKKGWTKRLQYGVIAQEFQKVFPAMVKKFPDGYLRVNYQELVPVLIEGVKELKKENEELKSRLDRLEKRLEKLEKERR